MNKSYISLLVFIVSCGGGGGGGGDTTPTTPAPVVSLSASPMSVLLTETSTLTWSSSNATSCSASGSWSGTKTTSGSEAVTISTAGNNTFTLACTGAGGSGSASATVEGYRNTDGVVVDGYISGADVFIDENDDWTKDSNENSTTSDNDGKFTIKYANGSLVSIGGTDLDSQTLLDNLLITHKLTGHSDFKAVTPVTSVAAFMTDAANVNAALGIDSTIDVAIFDPVANKGDGGVNDYLYEKGNQLTVLAYALQNITNDLNTTIETTQDYFKAITEEIETEFNETASKVDIETETFITKTLDNVIAAKTLTITDDAKANTTKALSGVMPIIEVKSSNDLTTSVIRFAVSTLQTDIKAIANGTASAETLTSYTTDVLNYIATDQNIDADEITPDISAIADSASTSEDTAVDINVLTNDSFITTAPITVTAANGSNGSTAVTSNVITYSPNADFNGTDTFTYSIIQGDKTSSADVSITVEAVNDAPSIDSASTIQVAENQIAVTTISVSDVDEDDLTLTLSGTDADSFNLSTDNVLTFKEAPDYETKSSYSITLTLTDGTETVTKDIIISVTNLNDVAPEFTSNATFSAEENQTAIGTVTASDAEGDEVTFSVSGTELAITSAGILTFKVTPDYETKSSYSAIVTSNDGLNTSTQDITVSVTNINEVPVITGNSEFSLDEDLPKYTVCSGGDLYGSGSCEVFYINATDPEGDNLTYSISGTDKDGFQVNSAGKVSTTFGPNYEQANDADANNIYEFIINVSDSFLSASKNIIVNVINLNDGPYFIGQNSFYNIPENQKSIGTFTGEDPDGDDYTISISGTDAELFNLSSNNALTFKSNPDFETKSSYQGIVAISDGQITADQSFQVTIKNLNDNNPVFTSPTTYSAAENQTAIGTVTATDADGDEITFTVSGTELAITSAGVLTFVAAPDFETKASYTATVTATDGVNDSTQDITVSVTNVNDIAPVISSDATFSAAENQTAIGTVTATDADGDEITFTVSGTELAITSAGVLTFASATDYETKSTYTATVTASDGANTTTQDITVNVTNVNDNSPVFTSSATYSAAENQSAISSVSATDADGDSVTFSVSGTELAITSAGVLTFSSAPDYETKATYTATVTASDGTNSTTQGITVNITDVNEAPTFTSSATFSAAENQTSIGSIVVSDPESASLTYSLSGLDNDSFSISISGELTFNSAPDYETKSTYSLIVTASDGVNNTNQDITINVTDVVENTAPVFTSNAAFTAAENQISIGSVVTSDAESDSITYSLSGTDASSLAISSSGVLTFSSSPDYETKTSYSASVTANDGTDSTSQAITITITNINDNNPVISSSASFSAVENQTGIGSVSASDADGDSLTYSLSGTDASSLSISSSGVLTFGSSVDYETKTSYSATVSVSDGTNAVSQNITISITNLNDNNPVISSSANFSAAENQTSIGSISASDADGGTLTYSLSGTDASSLSISSSGVLSFNSAPDYEAKTSYSASVGVTDGTNAISQNVTISISNLNDNSPAISSNASFSADENQTSIGSISASDADGGTLTYSLSGTDASSLSISSSGLLTFNSAPDYETKTSYAATVTVSDGSNTAIQNITISIIDKNDNAPIITSDAVFAVNENQTAAGTVTATDADSSSLTYAISGTDASSLSISSSGVLTFGSAPDYETKTSYVITVSVSDETDTTSQNVTININNLNDNNPAISSGASFSSNENQTSIGSVSASDADGDSLTYSLSGTDASSLSISSSGVLTFGSAPDYEVKNSYSATVGVTDGTNAVSQNITVGVVNLNDNSPAISSSASFSAAENQTAIGSVSAADADGDSLTYSLSGTDASSLAISSSGVLTFASSPDYETKSSYSAIVGVTDGTNAVSQNITITVTDVTDTYKISGTALASRYMVIDSDVPNTSNHSSSGNEYGSAQVIQNPITVIGHTGNDTDKDGSNTTDAYDLYQVTLTNNMYVRLEVSEYSEGEKDLDLYLFETNGSARNFTYATGSTEDDEYIDLPSSGTILIQVNPVNGSSKYKLTLGQRVIPSSSEVPYDTEHVFIPNQFIKTNLNNFNGEDDARKNNKEILNKELNLEVDRLPSIGWENESLIRFNLNSSRKLQNIKEIDSKDSNLNISDKQKEYLYHWKLKLKLQSKFFETDFGFNYPIKSFASFSKDPLYSYQWNFPAINAEAGLNAVGQERKNIVVAVLDTGSPPTNSAAWADTDFISGGIDFVNQDGDPTDPDASANYLDSNGRILTSHGTHVATTIGTKNDGSNINGFGVKVMPIKVLKDKSVGGGTNSLANLVEAIKYVSGASNTSGAVAPTSEGPIKVINMSLGSAYATSCPTSLQTVIDYAVSQGITVVAAAGNEALKNPGGSSWPALCNNVTSVANLTQENVRASTSDYNATVDIAAPGTDIPAWDKASRIEYMSGTSMAAPIVSGVIANMYSLDSGLTPAEVDTYIAGTNFSNDIGDSGRDNLYGYGALDFAKAAKSVISGEGLSKTYAYASQGLIDFGFSTTSINIVLNKVGSGTLSVNNLAADNATGLTYNSSTDTNGFGTYTINFDRTDYPNGEYGNVIYFNMSDGTSPAVAMRYAKGSQPDRADLGKVFIGLYNSSNNAVATGTLDMDGSLAFETTGKVAIGNYYYIISTDIDNDGFICTPGEICEIYPLSDSSNLYISVTDKAVSGDTVLLRAISGGVSGLSSYDSSGLFESKNNKSTELPLINIEGISAANIPIELVTPISFDGIPFQTKESPIN